MRQESWILALVLGLPACAGERAAAPLVSAHASAQQVAAASAPGEGGVGPARRPARDSSCPECQDGFGKNCYFDSTLHNASELKVNIHMPRETEEACFALESFSTCYTCYHRYFLRKGDELVPVSAAEFERAIAEKNKSCDNCLQFVQSGPG
jgi:uncharacterized low-complexity protein